MKANRKYIVSLLLLFLLMGLTFYLLFHHFEFAEIWGIIQSASGGPLAVAVMMVPVYLLCYGGVMQLFLRSFGYRTGLLRCTGYGCIDFYYSAITPSSTGGQPMVIYHMEKDGVPMSKAVLAPLVHTVLYKVVLILFTVAGLVCCPGLVRQGGGGVFPRLNQRSWSPDREEARFLRKASVSAPFHQIQWFGLLRFLRRPAYRHTAWSWPHRQSDRPYR